MLLILFLHIIQKTEKFLVLSNAFEPPRNSDQRAATAEEREPLRMAGLEDATTVAQLIELVHDATATLRWSRRARQALTVTI